MPKIINAQDRGTVDLHAHWYSPVTEPSDTPVRTLSMTLVDGEEHWLDAIMTDNATGEYIRYIERVTIYETGLYADQQYVQSKLYGKMNFTGRNAKPSGDDLAQTRTLLYLRRIVAMTDEDGRICPLTESNITQLPEQDITFIDAAITRLTTSPVPVLDADRAEAARKFARQQSQLARGAPIAEPLTEEAMVAREAQEAFPGDPYRHLRG